MSANVSNTVAFLRTTRSFPEEPSELSEELSKAYLDIANVVNRRTIGLFPVRKQAIGGESWFLTSQKQQNFRQVYTFTAAGPIPHGINFENVSQFSKPSGSYYDGTNYNGAIYASSVPIAGQVTFYIDPTNIVVLLDAGAPPISKGLIVLEWLSNI